MSTDKNGGGVFDYEGGDMEYLVEWDLDDGSMYVLSGFHCDRWR